MATRVQKQIAWALWLKNLTEMLEQHLVEIKQQPGSNLQHPKPLAHGKHPHNMLHWENLGSATATSAGSNLPVRHSTDQTDGCHMSHGIPLATPGINQNSPWADWPPWKKSE
jgi:hypothetical protein